LNKKKKKKKISIRDKALTYAVKIGDISIDNLPKNKKNTVRGILKKFSDSELEYSFKNKYKYSKRKVKHRSKQNESVKDEFINNDINFKNIITNIDEWEDVVKGGKAKNKHPKDFNVVNLSKGSEIEMEHTDNPYVAIDIAMDHLSEFDDYYDDNNGLPNMENNLKEIDINKKETTTNMKTKNNQMIKSFSDFNNIYENTENEPKMYSKENKFKRSIEYSDEVVDSLEQHNFTGDDKNNEGEFIIFDILDKKYTLVNDEDDDIRPCNDDEFDHIMNNL